MTNLNLIKKVDSYKAIIEAEHAYYVNDISKNAASLSCCAYLLALYDLIKPNRVLDLGSGFSSFCLRLFKSLNSLNTEIYSVDTNKAWLQKSKDYCEMCDLDPFNFRIWDEFIGNAGVFDLIFVDIDMSPKRRLYFKPVFDQLSKDNTFVLLDDMHKSAIGYPFDKLMKKRSYEEFDIKELTMDHYGRFCRLIKVKK